MINTFDENMAYQREPPPPGKLVIRGYAPGTQDDEIRSWFETFGPLEEGMKETQVFTVIVC